LLLRNERARDSLSSVYVDQLHVAWDALAAGGVGLTNEEEGAPEQETDVERSYLRFTTRSARDMARAPAAAGAVHAAGATDAAKEPANADVDMDAAADADVDLAPHDTLVVTNLEPGRYTIVARPPPPASALWWRAEASAGHRGGAAELVIAPVPPDSQVTLWREGQDAMPAAIDRNRPSDLWATDAGREDAGSAAIQRDGTSGAHWLAIGHADLLPALEPLAAWRRAQGLRTRLIDVQDVWDEGAFGSPDPAALAALLAHARRTWRPAPRYVLLVGEANLDHRGADAARRRQPGPPDLLPAWTLERADGRVQSSDLPYADPAGTGVLPEGLALGRLPGASVEQVAAAVAKILAWEEASGGAGSVRATRRALLVDDASSRAVGDTSAAIAARLASTLPVTRLDGARWRTTGEDLPAALHGELAAGAWLVGYVGHGNADTWANWPVGGRLLHAHDLEDLPAAPRGLLVAASCLNGAFDHPVKAGSLAERWLLAPGGGVAAWAPSGYTRLPAQAALIDALAAGIAADLAPGPPDASRLGDLVAAARRAALAERPDRREASLGMVLFGDPAMPLRPGAGAQVVTQVAQRASAVHLPWAAR
jgi:hypothetical protein